MSARQRDLARRVSQLLAHYTARGLEQRTICAECGYSSLAHDRAIWTESEDSFCPPCFPGIAMKEGEA